MMFRYYIAMDLHKSHTVLEAQTRSGRVVRHLAVETQTRTLIDAVTDLRGPRGVVLEEGCMADWAYRTLLPYADEVVVCDPRRNRLIAEGDKEDHIDASNLCRLYRLGEIRAVHHPATAKALDLRRWVWLYHDQVELVTAAKNKIKAAYRFSGTAYGKTDVYAQSKRSAFLKHLPRAISRLQMEQRYKNLDQLNDSCQKLRMRLYRIAKRHPVVKTFLDIPGYGPIHALTFYVIVDTPWRFSRPQKLWAYAGLGIQRHKSGPSKAGRPHSNGPERLNQACNRRLKNVAKGVATVAIAQGDNPFARTFKRLVAQGTPVENAKTTVARKVLRVPWAMWKKGELYRPECVGNGMHDCE